MLRLRPKLGSERSSEWRCCFCLHVRTGTMLFGIWHLILHIVALGVLAMILHEPGLLRKLQANGAIEVWGDDHPAPLPTPLSKVDTPDPYTNNRDGSLVYHDVDMGALVTICTMAITMMLIYGAAKGKPGHLLPFFCLQLFDFAITTLTATSYLCYLRSVHRVVAESRHVPWRAQLLQLSPAALSLLVLTAFITAMLVKAYCISMVWRCYKYLTMRQHAIRTLMPYTEAVCSPPTPPPPPSASLPDYEEALKQAPPPSYQAAMQMETTPAVVITTTAAVVNPTTAVVNPVTSSSSPSQVAPAPQQQAV